jgi:hypothetical protein
MKTKPHFLKGDGVFFLQQLRIDGQRETDGLQNLPF